MRCELKTRVDVQCVDAFAEVGMLVRRPELGHICRAASGRDDRITEDLVEQSLPGLSRAAARNVREWCYTVGLCAGHDAALTPQGHEAAKTDMVPMPEQGVYGMWLADHPLMGTRVLHLVRRYPDENGPRSSELEPLVLVPDSNRTFTSVVDPEQRYVIRRFPASDNDPQCVERGIGECELRWTLDFDRQSCRWVLSGTLGNARGGGQVRHGGEEPDLDLVRLQDRLAHEYLQEVGTWDIVERRLAVSFDGVVEEEFDTFCSTLTVPTLVIPGQGTYDDVTLEEVPIGPATEQDAEAWAHALLLRKVEQKARYLSRADVGRLFSLGVENTPLAPFDPVLRPHDALVGKLEQQPALWWHLVAPVDLSPFPLSPEELGKRPAARRGSGPRRANHEQVVRIPPKARWSMQELVNRLLAGIDPARVLLCDRYVKGQNLTMLGLWAAAVREHNPGVVLDVFTLKASREEDNFGPIRKCTGSKARDFAGVFGSKRSRHPHDRYVLVASHEGEAVAWQLTNSPLDAVPPAGDTAGPESPLRWRDLAGHRVPPEELLPELASWLKGGVR